MPLPSSCSRRAHDLVAGSPARSQLSRWLWCMVQGGPSATSTIPASLRPRLAVGDRPAAEPRHWRRAGPDGWWLAAHRKMYAAWASLWPAGCNPSLPSFPADSRPCAVRRRLAASRSQNCFLPGLRLPGLIAVASALPVVGRARGRNSRASAQRRCANRLGLYSNGFLVADAAACHHHRRPSLRVFTPPLICRPFLAARRCFVATCINHHREQIRRQLSEVFVASRRR